jgi:TolB-like protein/tetratricopeptide (TPR) repeat protein
LTKPTVQCPCFTLQRKDPSAGRYASAIQIGRSKISLLAVIAVLAIGGIGLYQFRAATPVIHVPVAVEYVDSVAVMPLDNLTGDADYDHVGIGIAEEIITHLARIPPLKVISSHSVQSISDQNLTFPQLGNLLNVRHIIIGSVELIEDSLLVNLRHINATENTDVWTRSIDVASDELPRKQEDIARYVTEKVSEFIPGLDIPDYNSHGDLGPGQEAHLAGRRWLGQRTAVGLNNAISELTRATELDPGYAPAYADLASAYALAIFYRYDVGGADNYILAARSLALAERALALDPNLAAGFAARGYLGALVGQTPASVAEDLDKAASLQPNAASIPSWRARSLLLLGQTEEAFSEASRAVDLDPLAPGRHIALAELSLQLGRYAQAISSARSAAALEPDIVRSRAIEGRALLLSGSPEQCAEIPLGPHRVLRATCLEAAGNHDDADAIIAAVISDIRADKLPGNGYSEVIAFEDLAIDFAMRGDVRNALFWSARAYSASPVGMEPRILESELFDDVRDNPEFSRALASIRADLYARVRRDSERFR